MAIAVVNASAAGDNTIVAAVAGKKVRVQRYELSNGAATANTAKWRSGTTDLTGPMYSAAALGPFADADAGETGQGGGDDFLFETAAGQALNLNLAAATAVGGWVDYSLE
jgi:hypothetical protein